MWYEVTHVEKHSLTVNYTFDQNDTLLNEQYKSVYGCEGKGWIYRYTRKLFDNVEIYLHPIIIINTENNFSDSVAAATFPNPTPVMHDNVKYNALKYFMPLPGPPIKSLVELLEWK